MQKGAPDLLYFIDGKTFAHELKAEKGYLKPEQKEFHEKLGKSGISVHTTYGWEEALRYVMFLGLIRGA